MSDLTTQEVNALTFMVEEEKLAFDVYTELAKVWNLPIFANISSRSETKHISSVETLANQYGISVPNQPSGVYANAELQALYDDLIAIGSQSIENALKVGIVIEVVDIEDLNNYLKDVQNLNLQTIFNTLLSESQKHLSEFTKTLSNYGQTLKPEAVPAWLETAINTLNHAPELLNTTLSVVENTANATLIGTINGTDSDADVLTYAIISGNIDLDKDGKWAVAIDSKTGQITVNDKDDLNYEGLKKLTLRTSVNDGQLTTTANTIINIKNLNETNQTFNGTASANIFYGGEGNDTLNGGLGKDTLSGGMGADTFIFNSKTGLTNIDTILDFTTHIDSIQLDDVIFSNIGKAGTFTATDGRFYAAKGAVKGHDADDRIIYNTTTGDVYYDADGSGAGAAVKIAVLGTMTHPMLVASDFVVI